MSQELTSQKLKVISSLKNSLKLSNFKRLFPEHANLHGMKKRKQEKYSVSKCKGKRYAVSSIPSMQKMLTRIMRNRKWP